MERRRGHNTSEKNIAVIDRRAISPVDLPNESETRIAGTCLRSRQKREQKAD
jgi:hypothetical protein